MKNIIMLQMRLDMIKNFLDHVVKEANSEIERINQKNENGEIRDLGELESLLDYPFIRLEIGARAVYYEINALIENELYNLAYVPWIESEKYKGPKHLDLNNLTNVESFKMIYDVKFKNVIKLIEDKYNIEVKNIKGWSLFQKIRASVNSFKHRDGFKDFRKNISDRLAIGEKHTANVDEAYSIIEQAFTLIKRLWEVTN